jgi:CubicO group peptidase (beta-lactamase class C family)
VPAVNASVPIAGTCDGRFAAVRRAFIGNFAEHGEIGAAVAVVVDGQPVVDLWGGHVDAARRVPWGRDTLVNVFSVGKAMATVCALLFVDRSRLDLDAPVSRFWPEFAAAGKAAITVRELLCHRAGLPAIRAPLPSGAIFSWETMTTALAGETPWWPPGRRHGYHVNTFGFLVGEVVRRVAGRTIGRVLRDDVAGPLGADVHIGLAPADHARVAEFVWPPEMAPEAVAAGATGDDDARLMIRNTYVNPPGLSGYGVVNTARWRRAEMPSTNTHATARGIARIYAALAAGGPPLLSRATLAQATTEHAAGLDAVLGRASRFGLGFQLPLPDRPLGPNPGVFGHFGAGGSLGFADPEARVAFAYVMNRMGPRWYNPTTRRLVAALYASL